MNDYDYGYGGRSENAPQSFVYTNGNYYPSSGNTPGSSQGADGAGLNPEPPKKRRGGFFAAVAGIAAASAFAGSLLTGYAILPKLVKEQISQTAVQVQETAGQTPLAGVGSEQSAVSVGVSNPVPDIAAKVKDSVVSISICEKTFIPGQAPEENAIAWGTGFVISDDGYILTNAHVVDGGNLIKVKTTAGDEYTAELVGKDSDSEVAVIKVENLGLAPVSIGKSEDVRTGDFVIAIGNPINAEKLQNTVTVGYVSSEAREITLKNRPVKMIQTDAAINPGNSGGPLLNDKGEVIGINTMKTLYVPGDTYGGTIPVDGIGFAIPITEAMNLADQLIENGSIVKPGIGFTYSPISAEDAKLWESPRGILIQNVLNGSPAQQAGLKVYDIITVIDGVDLKDGAEVPEFSSRNVGDEVTATVWRDGKEFNVTFILTDLNKLEDQFE